MTPHTIHRMSPAAAALIESLEGRTIFEREYALHIFTAGLEEAMKAEGLTKADLARLIGKKVQAVSRALKGKQNLTVGTLMDMAVALGKTVDLSVVDLPEVQTVIGSRAFMDRLVRNWNASISPADSRVVHGTAIQSSQEIQQNCFAS